MSNVISVRGLKKSYGANQAVASIDLTIEGGEIFALLGPNGAGKTTTVEILGGFRTRDAGDVSVLGTDPAIRGETARVWRNRIGIVLQSTSDAGDLSVRETVSHFAKYYSKPKDVAEVISVQPTSIFKIYKKESIDPEKVAALSKFFNLNLFDYYFSTYSSNCN